MGQIMGGYMIMTIGIWLFVPLAGMLADKFGVRRVALSSLALYALIFAGFSLGTGALWLYFLTWILIAIVGTGSLPPVWTRSVNQAFERQKGFALGIAAMGTGLFGALLKPLTALLIDALGWRGAYVALALLPLLVALPIAFFYFKESPRPHAISAAPTTAPTGISLREALGDYRFWILAFAFPVASFAIIAPIPNAENILRTLGVGEDRIVLLVGGIGAASIAGRVLGGILIDHIWAPAVAFGILVGAAAACFILSMPAISVPLALIAILLIGFGVGAELDLVGFLVARYFGVAHYASLYGVFYGLCFLAGGVGPWVFGSAFDREGTYATVLAVSGVLLIVTAFSFLLLGRYRYAPQHSTSADSRPQDIVRSTSALKAGSVL